MYLKIGSHTFALGQVALSIQSEVEENDAGEPLLVRKRWSGQGLLTTQQRTAAAAAADIDSQVATLNTVLVNGVDIRLTMPNGTTLSQHQLLSADCIGGTRLVSAGVPTFERAGGITNLPFTFVYEGEVPVEDAASLLRSFEETIQFSGGGPLYGHIVTQSGLPVKQLLRRNTVYRAVQSGQAVGYLARPTPPLPIWLGAQVRGGELTVKSPRRRVDSFIDFSVAWSFEFESAFPLIGNPHVWL
jgi:hypothetical protein